MNNPEMMVSVTHRPVFDTPLETLAFQCFLAQLSNPVKNEYRTEFSVLAKRSFDAAEAFCQEAWNQKKGKKV